jgi:hypothetical protein
VTLDKATLKPLRLSMPFYFKTHGIEYCTGFHVADDTALFVYSTWDANPAAMKVPLTQFEFLTL